MEVSPSAITVMLDRLENLDFLTRIRDKVDRRVVIIELTDAGEEKLNEVLKYENKSCIGYNKKLKIGEI